MRTGGLECENVMLHLEKLKGKEAAEEKPLVWMKKTQNELLHCVKDRAS